MTTTNQFDLVNNIHFPKRNMKRCAFMVHVGNAGLVYVSVYIFLVFYSTRAGCKSNTKNIQI